MATKSDKRQVRGLIEGLEYRAHRGPPVGETEIQSVRDLLRQRGFSQASDYFHRLTHLANRLQARSGGTSQAPAKRNYGGTGAERQMQVQSVFDHVLLSTCYAGDFNGKRGRVKISHRFNQQGRMDFVELKFLRALHPLLNGELRKLVLIKGYPSIRKDWLQAEAAVLRILPQELVFLYEDIFKSPKAEIIAWLLNIGHGMAEDLLKDLNSRPVNGLAPACAAGRTGWIGSNRSGDLELGTPVRLEWLLSEREGGGFDGASGNGQLGADDSARTRASQGTINGEGEDGSGRCPSAIRTTDQLPLEALVEDEVALPILEKAAGLQSAVEFVSPGEAAVRYIRRGF